MITTTLVVPKVFIKVYFDLINVRNVKRSIYYFFFLSKIINLILTRHPWWVMPLTSCRRWEPSSQVHVHRSRNVNKHAFFSSFSWNDSRGQWPLENSQISKQDVVYETERVTRGMQIWRQGVFMPIARACRVTSIVFALGASSIMAASYVGAKRRRRFDVTRWPNYELSMPESPFVYLNVRLDLTLLQLWSNIYLFPDCRKIFS